MYTMRAALLCLSLFLFYGQDKVKSSEYHMADAIEDLNFFIPGSKVILTTAIKIWTVYGEVRQLIDPNSTSLMEEHLQEISNTLSEITEQLDLMSDKLDNISDDIRDVKNLITDKVINDLPKELSLDNKLINIYGDINKVNGMFEKFLLYNNVSKHYENSTLINFANRVVDHSLGELSSVLNQIHHSLVDRYTGINMLDIMSNSKLASSMMCKRRESAQHFINNLYNNIMLVETKALIMTQFAYSVKNAFSNKTTSYITELDDATTDSYIRTSASIAEIKKAMYVAPRDVWSCDPPEHKEDETYTKLAPIFQTYIMKENDAGISSYLNKYTNKCSDTCTERTDTYDLCRTKYCQQHGRKCSGRVHDCKSSSAELKICEADKNSTKRYNSITLTGKQAEVLGSIVPCARNTAINLREKIHYIYRCEYCFCICDDSNTEIDRYFSLRNVTSDANKNYVVTGIRFAKKNNIIHIQIEQGQLLKNGNVNESTAHWKAVDNFTIYDKMILIDRDYHNITWSQRSVDLDTVDSPLNNVITGLRFQNVDGHLKLEIQVTPIDFYRGELKIDESTWISNSKSVHGRIELNVENLDLGTSTYVNLPDSSTNQFLKFTTSSMKTDVGQTVVPFIDLQDVTSSPPVLLSGAGLIHRGDKQSAGFLSFKAITYNYAPYLQEK